MHFTLISATALLAAMASAIHINQPSNTTVWAPSAGGAIQWDSVSTDQQTFILKITGPSNPVDGDVISESVETSAGSYSYTPASALAAGQYRINVVSADPANPGILAQSEYFTVGDGTASTDGASTESTSGTVTGTMSGSMSFTDNITQVSVTSTESATPDSTPTIHSTKAPKSTTTPAAAAAETPAQNPASPPNAPVAQSSSAEPAPAPAPSADTSSANAETTPGASSGAGKLLVPSSLFAVAFAAFTLLA